MEQSYLPSTASRMKVSHIVATDPGKDNISAWRTAAQGIVQE